MEEAPFSFLSICRLTKNSFFLPTEELCQCPHKCDASVPLEARRRLFEHFYGLGEADLQNQFLRKHMDLRARLNAPTPPLSCSSPDGGGGSGRPPRRITCKYLVPLLPSDDTVEVCQKAFVSAFVITTKRVRLQREKLIASLGLNSYSSHNRSKNNNNNPATANNNKLPVTSAICETNNNSVLSKKSSKLNLQLYSATQSCDEAMDLSSTSESRKSDEILRAAMSAGRNAQHHHLRNQLQNPAINPDNPLLPLGLFVPEGVTIFPVTASADHVRDIAIVHNFFSNQLWKPEYIGAYS
ncbi:unnamed protein product [Acanthoscelides obtectus]|uniref:Uncharacterized protein n=1 Tax=Acanthoscelides obtectus TaxID=200917 RepID=A0A9P0MH58_ACAOB|nr:unnamed protein product [Acanthoscelides obtectus]CAK1626422.1 hypothetical protein AOBTE_LOCUS3833 [Acanthoscelides obtectus]